MPRKNISLSKRAIILGNDLAGHYETTFSGALTRAIEEAWKHLPPTAKSPLTTGTQKARQKRTKSKPSKDGLKDSRYPPEPEKKS